MTSNLIRVLVMYECNNRRLILPEDIRLEGLIKEFMCAFQDVIPPNVAPTHFLFQKFDPGYQEWVDMTEDEEIHDREKIKVLFLAAPIPPGVYPHLIQDDTTYRIWSLVSRSNSSLMKRNDTTMKCNGNLSDNEKVLNIKTKDDSIPKMKLYRLEIQVPNDQSKIYLVTGKGEDQNVKVQKVDADSPPNTTDTKFEPQYFYSFTMFRCQQAVNGETDLYLASDHNGKLTLAKRGPQKEYPNPATLFICCQVI